MEGYAMSNLRIFRSGGWYVAELPSLHVVTRARTLSSLKRNLKEAVEVAIDGLLEVENIKRHL